MTVQPQHQPDVVLDSGETACGDLIMQIFQQMKALRPGQILEVVVVRSDRS